VVRRASDCEMEVLGAHESVVGEVELSEFGIKGLLFEKPGLRFFFVVFVQVGGGCWLGC